jgi:hypothetical protein
MRIQEALINGRQAASRGGQTFILDRGQHWSDTVGCIANQTFRLQTEPRLNAINHRLRRIDLCCSMCWRCLDINNDSDLWIDQVVGRIGIGGWAARRMPKQ